MGSFTYMDEVFTGRTLPSVTVKCAQHKWQLCLVNCEILNVRLTLQMFFAF